MASFEERLYENNLDCFHFIQSKFADKLNYNEKLLFLYEMELDDVLYVDEEGNVKEVKKTKWRLRSLTCMTYMAWKLYVNIMKSHNLVALFFLAKKMNIISFFI